MTAVDLAELQQIVSKGEDGRHQFKEDVRNADSLAAEIVAFSNSRGGRIFIGVSNEGSLKGLFATDVHRINQLISNTANQHVRSPVAVQTENSELLKKFYHEKLPKLPQKRLQFLENMGLAAGKRLNLAGLLLFGQKPQLYKPQFVLKAVCFPGAKIGHKYLDSEDFEGPLPTVFQGALGFILRNLRKVQGQKGVNTIGDPEIPQTVFEELLVNALIHRDYFICAPIRLFVFDDRIEIISPGSLPDHLTVEKIRAGNSIQRNPILTSFIAKGLLPYRGLGTGVRRALEEWPKIKFIDDHDGCLFTAVIERVNAPINAPLSDLQVQILEVLHQNPSISYEDLFVKLEKDRSTIRRNIQKLKLKGFLRRAGSKKKGCWEVIKNT